jgi:hypothetical protein
MKFKDYLQEDKESNQRKIDEWLKDWSITAFQFNDEVSVNGENIDQIFDIASLRLLSGLEGPDINARHNATFIWPFDKNTPNGTEWSIQGTDGKTAIIENFKSFPEARHLSLIRNVQVLSFEGIENVKLFELNLRYLQTNIECGLIRLLKNKTLQSIAGPNIADLHELKAAIQIVDKHLDTRDIFDCMDELIEAGLKKYAKL